MRKVNENENPFSCVFQHQRKRRKNNVFSNHKSRLFEFLNLIRVFSEMQSENQLRHTNTHRIGIDFMQDREKKIFEK